MLGFLDPKNFDLTSPDGCITHLTRLSDTELEASVFIENISPLFVGFQIDPRRTFFNIKSTLAQVGVDGIGQDFELDKNNRCATVKVLLKGIDKIGILMLKYLKVGCIIGKLFAADERRRVRDPDYLSRMFGRSDRRGRPLLSLGGMHGSTDLILDKLDGRTVAYLSLQSGRFVYDDHIEGLLPTIAKAMVAGLPIRDLLRLHQEWKTQMPRNLEEGELLLVRTLPLHIRTVFGKVVDDLLSSGYHHTSACILQPDTYASGDIYELYGKSKRELTDIPVEFYTLEPYREHVFFQDRDQLQICLEDSNTLFKAFETAPKPDDLRAAVFIVKGQQMLSLKPEDWIAREVRMHEFPGLLHGERQGLMVERYIEQLPSYPFLKAISDGLITSQGILLSRYFPSPLMKRMLLGDQVQRNLKGIYFQYPSHSERNFFSAEDRALLHDLEKFAIPVYWVDEGTGRILKYVQKTDRDSGMFVPNDRIVQFLKSTVFGIYGSNLVEGNFEEELMKLMKGVLEMRGEMHHPMLNKDVPLSLVTGGGPGAMAVGNRVAKELQILSCANIVDFGERGKTIINEQKQNPFVEAKMTYRIDKLVERQAEFNLDFPIFLMGGIGTDFEFSLEMVRRKVGSVQITPIILFGSEEYWNRKISGPFRCNLENGTIKGSEWVGNSCYCIQNADQGIKVYRQFFEGTLPLGPNYPMAPEGFVTVS